MSYQQLCGTGSRGVIVYNIELDRAGKSATLLINSRIYRNTTRKVYKIMTDGCIHYRDVTQASYLTLVDPMQKHFVYPVATYTMPGNKPYLEHLDRQNPVPGKRFNVNAPKIYVDIMPYAGTSLYALRNKGHQFTPQQAIAVIKNLVEGIAIMHRANTIHGDIHEHNVVIDISSSIVCARWIDFSEMKAVEADDFLKMQSDVKRLIGMVKMIVGMVPGDNENLDRMAYEIGRGSAPMSAMGLQSIITPFFKHKLQSRSRSRSSSSSSKKRVSKKLAL